MLIQMEYVSGNGGRDVSNGIDRPTIEYPNGAAFFKNCGFVNLSIKSPQIEMHSIL
jgi:hypothetical protein